MKLKFKSINILLVLSGFFSSAQSGGVGIGTSSPNSGALLDLTAVDKGLLYPRVNLTSTDVWGLAGLSTAGMSVYNTNANITNSFSTNPASGGTYPTSANGVGVYTWDGFGWVAKNAAPEVLKVSIPTYPVGAGPSNGGSTVSGTTTAIPLNNPVGNNTTFNTIAGSTVTPATGAVFLPAGTYKISASLACLIRGTSTNNQYIELTVSTTPTSVGNVIGLYNQPTNSTLAGYLNGSSTIKIGAAGSNIYFVVWSLVSSGSSWAVSTASPQSYATIERIH